jgi:hypothetical protein
MEELELEQIQTDESQPVNDADLLKQFEHYSAAQLLLGSKLAEAFKTHPNSASIVDSMSARIPDGEDLDFYDGIAAGLLYAALVIQSNEWEDEMLGNLSLMLTALSEYTDTPGLDLLHESEVLALLRQVPDLDENYDETMQEINAMLDSEGLELETELFSNEE